MERELIFARAGFGADAVPYQQAWDLQRDLHERRVRGDIPDTCLLLEHPPVYTAGKRTDELDRPAGDPGAPVIDVDRGGKITWHGPGQLTGYPIIKLREPMDVVAYVRALEEAMIRTCAEFGVAAAQVAGRSGAWIPGDPDRKVGAIGAGVTTLSAETGRQITVADVTPVLERHLADVLGYSAWRRADDAVVLTGDDEALLASR